MRENEKEWEYVVWGNEDMAVPVCIEKDENGDDLVIDYDPDFIAKGEVIIYRNGYAYFRPENARYPWDSPIESNLDFDDFVDEDHPVHSAAMRGEEGDGK